jgi:hypothetical protein
MAFGEFSPDFQRRHPAPRSSVQHPLALTPAVDWVNPLRRLAARATSTVLRLD